MSAERVPFLTPEEYLAIEREAETKSEYYRGQMFAMAGGYADHSLLASNVLGVLHAQLRGGRCRAYNSDLRVHIPTTGLYTYPDVMVICGPREYVGARRDTVTNPVVIVEVLSSSTESYDRGSKFAHYRTLESLQEYVLVSQGRQRIERFLRRSDGEWLYAAAEGSDGAVELPSIKCRLTTADAYDGVELEPGAAPKDPL